jgi:hypothetical protein
MDDVRKVPVPRARFPSRRHALLYLCVFAILLASANWASVAEHPWDVSCPGTTGPVGCRAFWAAELPFLVLLTCGSCLNWLARRTARSLTASGVPISGWKGMPAWLIVEVLMLLGCFVPVALRQLWERRE